MNMTCPTCQACITLSTTAMRFEIMMVCPRCGEHIKLTVGEKQPGPSETKAVDK